MNAPSRDFLRERTHQRERMDDPAIDEPRFTGALRGLRRVNWFTRGAAIVWPLLRHWAEAGSGAPLRVLDVACGGGDGLVALTKRFRAAGISATVDGCDRSASAVRVAAELAARNAVQARFFEFDANVDVFPDTYDVILCSLFLHHLARNDALRFLQNASAAARRGVVVHDLVRSRSGWWLAYSGVRLLLCNDVCREDGPRSVECAFTIEEARTLALEAGLERVSVEARFPFRFLLAWEREP